MPLFARPIDKDAKTAEERSKMLLRDPLCSWRLAWTKLQIGIILVWKRHLCSVLHLLLVLLQQSLVDSCGGRGKSWSSNEFLWSCQLTHIFGKRTNSYQSWVTNKLPGQPQEWLLEVVVGLCRYVVILQIFLSVERNSFGLYLSLLHINLISGKDDRDVLAYTDQITC